MRVKIILDDLKTILRYDVHEVTIEEKSAIFFTRHDQLVIKEDDSDEKW